jgi:hypothetical protein
VLALIDRGLLAQQLRKIAAGEVYFLETKRRERLGNQLAEISRDPGQRRIVIPAAQNLAYRELSGPPATIRIGPGKLEITRIDAQDLLRQLMELAQARGGTLV